MEIEREIGYAFPEDYVEFLLLHNGGRPSPEFETFYINDFEESSSVDFFYSCDHSTYPSLEILNKLAIYRERIPIGTVPIGKDSFGNQILLGVSSELADQVFFWDHEREGFTSSANSFHNIIKLSDSFEEFIDSLSSE